MGIQPVNPPTVASVSTPNASSSVRSAKQAFDINRAKAPTELGRVALALVSTASDGDVQKDVGLT